jgi:dTDP-4-dehydrorhamnose reductase
MSNILVTGANGQLGSEIRAISKNYPDNFLFTDINDLDITKKSNIEKFISENRVDSIINCAAYTAVDRAEDEKELIYRVNSEAVKNMAEISKERDLKLIHISTDYVFDGKNHKPYTSDDRVNPVNSYGASKLSGEKAIFELSPKNSIIIRTSWVYSSFGNNFVKTMLKYGKEREELKVVFDQVGTPTYARDLAKVILNILPKIDNQTPKIYHYSNDGAISWFDFAKEIMKMAKVDCKITPIESFEYPTKAERPFYSVLNKREIKSDFLIDIPYWKDSLRECLVEMGEKR